MTFPTKSIQRLTSAAALALVCAAGTLNAQTVHWGNALLDTLIQSDGTEITAGDGFTFQIGVFQSGFTPTSGNPENWLANWRPLDGAAFNDDANFFNSTFDIVPDSVEPQFGTSNSPEAYPGLQVQAGQQLWMFVYNNTNMDTTTELFLAGAGTWTLPTVANNQMIMPGGFRVSQIVSAPVFGGANDLRGGGNYSGGDPGFELQTATFIPEPSAVLLQAAGLFALCTLRRRGPRTDSRS